MSGQSVLGKAEWYVRTHILKQPDARTVLLQRMPKDAVCAEIGVWKGGFSRQILELTSPRSLHLIDPWEFQSEFPDRMYGGTVARDQTDMDAIFEDVREALGGRSNVHIHRGYSEDVMGEFPDGHFDWVYIDGNHYYEFVKRDLTLASEKVKPGGFITGDDYYWGARDGYPVGRAIQEAAGGKVEIVDTQFILRVPGAT